MSEQPEKVPVEVEFEGFGVKSKLKGWHFGNILQLAIVGGIVACGFIFYNTGQAMKKEHEGIAEVLQNQQKVLEKQLDAQVEFNYIITLRQDEREKLNLRMPESLRGKVREFR
jgi:hypothetical protein